MTDNSESGSSPIVSDTAATRDSVIVRTDATNCKRTGDQAFGSQDDVAVKVGRSVTLQPTPQAGDTEKVPAVGTLTELTVAPPGVLEELLAAPSVILAEMLAPPSNVLAAPSAARADAALKELLAAPPVAFVDPVVSVVVSPAARSVTAFPVVEEKEVSVETGLAVTASVASTNGEVASTVSGSKSSGSVSSTLQADELNELQATNTEELDEGFRALADLIDTSSKKCSYNEGYVKRQLVYACRTCTLDVLEPAGFCMACAVHCHDEHDVVPMLTRRTFRCDCGNTKFGPRRCQLSPDKLPTNSENVYNQNFHGKICTCKKSLEAPVASSTDDDDIVQCRLCEEQFHAAHLGVTEEDFGEDWDGELICHNCLNKHPFLQLYQADLNQAENVASPPAVGDCILAGLRVKFGVPEKALKGFVFPAGWWETLCKCEECSDMYDRKKIQFILDAEDTFVAYEQREASRDLENVQRASDMSPEDIFAQICDGFDTVTQVELAHWFNNLREVFVAFLQTRIQEGQTITDADIEEFFATFSDSDNNDKEGDVDHDAL